jgi:hypothetical protein
MKNIRNFFEREMSGLDTELRKLPQTDRTPLEHLREEMYLIRNCQMRLHDHVQNNPFADESEEIDYHKYRYPQLRALHIFRVEVYLIRKDLPPLGKAGKKAYYAEQLQLLFAYIRRYEFLYTYYKLRADDLDTLLFTGKGNRQSLLLPVLADAELSHTTETGYLFARFMAYEMLFRYIVGQLENRKRPFTWTGEAINLIEVLHGIHLNGQVNDGEVGIVEWFEGMGEFFGLDLGIPKKGFDGLKKRKKLSKTHFTDRMRDRLVERMDEEDDWEREKMLKNKAGF